MLSYVVNSRNKFILLYVKDLQIAAKEAAPAKKEEPKEESDEDMGFGLFD